jgi:hypothetical protein
MEIGESQALMGQPIQIRRVDLATERTDVGEPEIVGDDHQEVRPLHGEASCQVWRPKGTACN